jgi:hypothetical protein
VTDGGWKYAAASVIGTSHQGSLEGVCQDSYGFQYLDASSAFVGVVSDGAGSASHSQIGSRRTCDVVLKRIAEASPSSLFSKSLAADVLERVRLALYEDADALGLSLRDFACTLLVAVVAPGRAAFWQIGDGAICFREEGADKFRYAFWPEKGDYANVTFFATDMRAQDHLEFDVMHTHILDLALFSDGLERLALDFVAAEAHSGFFNGLFPHIRSLPEGYSAESCLQIEGFLGSERVNRRTDDDKTLILASRAL